MRSDNNILQVVIRGASIFLIGTILSNVFQFGFNLLLSNRLGADVYGTVTYIYTIVLMLSVVGAFGADKALMKIIPNSESRSEVFSAGIWTTLVFSVILSFTVYFFSDLISGLTLDTTLATDSLKILAIGIIALSIMRTIEGGFRSLELPKKQAVVQHITKPGFLVLSAVLVYTLQLDGETAVLVISVSLLVAMVVSAYYFISQSQVAIDFVPNRDSFLEFNRVSTPLVVKDAGSFLYNRMDIIMVGIFLASSTVGIYRIAALVTMVLSIPLTGVNQLFPTIASGLYQKSEIEQLSRVYSTVSRWVFSVVLIVSIPLLLSGEHLLSVFGNEFSQGSVILSLLIIGQIINSCAGPAAYVLVMSNHERLVSINQITFGVMNVVMNYILIERYGAIGAAIATTLVLSMLNITRIVELIKLERIHPFSVAYAKPVTAAIVVAAIGYAGNGFVRSFLTFVVMSILLGIIYLIFLYAFGIEQDDKDLINSVLS